MAAVLERIAAPWLALATRLWLAQAFLAVQIAMAMLPGEGLAAPWGAGRWAGLARDIAVSGPGGAIQALCPLLLVLGLLARPAAAAMLLQAAVLPMPGVAPELRLFWLMLLGWIVVFGPGPLSLDRLLGPGVSNSALPSMAAVAAAYRWTTRVVGPVFLLLLRLWLAVALASLALPGLSAATDGVAEWLPRVPAMIAMLPPPLALLLAALIALGLLTRPAALIALALVPVGELATLGDHRLYWLLLLAILVVQGGGRFSLDRLLAARMPAEAPATDDAALPHVVIVGGGFGGVAAARGLRGAPCRITLIDRRNHHLFQPLLYQVATAGLSPADIATPIRTIFRGQPNVRVLLGEVTGVDLAANAVMLGDARIPYDHLVLATGARHSYFGHEEWSPVAPGLKTVEDAIAIRRRLLLAFEAAEDTEDPAARAAWLTFVIVGAGPTGVELAGAIAELARQGLEGEFRSIEPASARVILVQSGPRVLPAFPPALSAAAERSLKNLGVEILLDRRVGHVDAQGATMDGEVIAARTVLWAAGVMASPAAAWVGAKPDPAGRLPVAGDLSLAEAPAVFAIGDTASSMAWNGKPVPGLAPAAKQQGAYVARVIRSRLAQGEAPPPFRYRHYGSLATIGRKSAVAEFGRVWVSGAPAWWLWGAAHIAFLAGGRNRAAVVVEWVWAYLTLRRGTRLITEPS